MTTNGAPASGSPDPAASAVSELVVGIDVGKAEWVVAVWDSQAQTGQALEPVANSDAGCALLAQVLTERAQQQGAGVIHLAVEPTGGYEAVLLACAHARGWRVSVVNAVTVRDWAKGLGRRAKTDRLDALMLARYTAERHPRLWQPPAAALSELEGLLTRRREVQQMLQAERNRQQQFAVRPELPETVKRNVQTVRAALEVALDEIEQALAEWRAANPPEDEQADRLDSLPGVGAKTVLPLLALLLRWDAITGGKGSDKALTAFVGLDPTVHTSGTSVRKRSLISRRGNPALRATLYMAALGALRGRNALLDYYDALVARGKPKRVALVACMRKLLTWAWHLFQTQQVYDPARHLKPA